MRIGEVAQRSGVSVRSLRYYEEQALLASTRSSSGQRHYGDEAVERVQLIQLLYSAGLSSKTIQDLLPCVVTGVARAGDLALLRAERARINQQMADLARARAALDEIIEIASDPALPCAHNPAATEVA